MSDEVEIWKAVPGFEGLYEASSIGRIRSMPRTMMVLNRYGYESPRRMKGKIRKQTPNGDGYFVSALLNRAIKSQSPVHRVVAAAFLGVSEMQVNHKDLNKKNNRIENLEYVTPGENTRHAIAAGHCVPRGERHHWARLSRGEAIKVLEMSACGISRPEIVKMTGYKYQTVTAIITWRNWKTLSRNFPWQHAADAFNASAAGTENKCHS